MDLTIEDFLLELLKNVEITKVAGIDQISGKFLKDGVQILAKPIGELRNLFMKLKSFSNTCKIAQVKPSFKVLCYLQCEKQIELLFYKLYKCLQKTITCIVFFPILFPEAPASCDKFFLG